MSISREVLSKYITPGCVFIETGTRWGDTAIKAAELGAGTVHTCEIDPMMAGIAKSHIADAVPGKKVFVYDIPSTKLLCNSYPGFESTTVIYLDAHTDASSEVLMELHWIFTWQVKPAVILIDDMRCMQGWGIDVDTLCVKLCEMGYTLKRENGVAPEDILVAQR